VIVTRGQRDVVLDGGRSNPEVVIRHLQALAFQNLENVYEGESEQERPADTLTESCISSKVRRASVATHVYPSDGNDEEWALLAPLIPPARPGGRPRSVEVRRIVNGVRSILRSGCAWRSLPREYGPWQAVYW
jgi:putative transposase